MAEAVDGNSHSIKEGCGRQSRRHGGSRVEPKRPNAFEQRENSKVVLPYLLK